MSLCCDCLRIFPRTGVKEKFCIRCLKKRVDNGKKKWRKNLKEKKSMYSLSKNV